MQVLVSHPVPVRWRPPRAGSDRHVFDFARTEVEIPEVDVAGFGPECAYLLATDKPERRYHVRDGRCWQRVQAAMIDAHEHGRRPATIDDLVRGLGRRAGSSGGLFRNLTPLAGVGTPSGPVPASILSRAAHDHTAAVRTALRAYVAQNLAIASDGSVWTTRGMPVIAPFLSDPLLDEAPTSLAKGPVFERPRFDRMVRFLSGADMRSDAVRFLIPMDSRFGDVPYDGRDLALFLHDGPARIERLQRLVGERVGIPAPAEAQVAALRPYADLGLVGAVPPGERPVLLDLMERAVQGLRAAITDAYDPQQLRWIEAYRDRVARFDFPQPPVPEADVDCLSDLAPGP